MRTDQSQGQELATLRPGQGTNQAQDQTRLETRPSSRPDQARGQTKLKARPSSRPDQAQDQTKLETRPSSRPVEVRSVRTRWKSLHLLLSWNHLQSNLEILVQTYSTVQLFAVLPKQLLPQDFQWIKSKQLDHFAQVVWQKTAHLQHVFKLWLVAFGFVIQHAFTWLQVVYFFILFWISESSYLSSYHAVLNFLNSIHKVCKHRQLDGFQGQPKGKLPGTPPRLALLRKALRVRSRSVYTTLRCAIESLTGSAHPPVGESSGYFPLYLFIRTGTIRDCFEAKGLQVWVTTFAILP